MSRPTRLFNHIQPPGKPENQPLVREKSVTQNLRKALNFMNLTESGAREELSLREREEGTGGQPINAGPPLHLPVAEYLAWVVGEHRRLWQLPRRGWESPLWSFLRLVKGHPDLINAEPERAFRMMNEVMRGWLQQASRPESDPWAAYLGVSRDDAQVETLDAWAKIRNVAGLSPLERALALATEQPLELPWEYRQGRPDCYARFLAVAGWLQVSHGAQPILLPVEAIGKLLGLQKMNVSRLRALAVKDGFLREAKGHDRVRRQATEFVFDVSRVPVLADRAEPGTVELFRGEPYLPGLAKEVVEHYLKTALSPYGSAGAIECVRYHFHRGRSVEQLKAVVDRFVKDQARLGRTPHRLCSAKNFFAPGGHCDCLLEEVEEQKA